MSENSKIVEVSHLSHSYNGKDWAIRDINFAIESKGVYGLLGSNGAGKSTTMNIICNVLTQTQGDVLIKGYDLRRNPIEAKRCIGFLPQKAPLHLDLTVYEYLYHCADVRLMPKEKIHEAIEKSMDRCGVTHFRDRLLRNLSGGYQQRVGIAQAIIHDPAFVILDEPTNGLDPNQILAVRELIREIARERAVLISTHILPEVQASCDQIMMIDHGKMVFSGTIHDFDTYLEPSALIVIMHHAPQIEELLKIKGVERIEQLTRTRIRIHFQGDTSIVGRVVAAAVEGGWSLREISLEKESLDKVFAKLSGK